MREMFEFTKKNYPKVLDLLSTGEKPTEQTIKQVYKLIEEFKKRFE